VAEVDASCREATDGADTKQTSGEENQEERIF
jgi:hypothetical protein